MGEALQPHVAAMRKIFKTFASMGAGVQSAIEMSRAQFGRFCRDVGILDGKRRDGTPNGCKTLHMGEVDLLFQRVNAKNLQSRSKAWAAAQGLAHEAASHADEVAAHIAEESGGGRDRRDTGEDDDGDTENMDQREFVTALVRLAWQCFPKLDGIGARIGALLDTVVLPMTAEVPGSLCMATWLSMATRSSRPSTHSTCYTIAIYTQVLERSDPMAAVLDMPRCKAVRGPNPLTQHSTPQTLTPTLTLTTDADPNPVLGDLLHAPNPSP